MTPTYSTSTGHRLRALRRVDRVTIIGATALLAVLVTLTVWALWPLPPAAPKAAASPRVTQIGEMDGSSPAETVTFSPDGRTLAAVYEDGSTRLWNVASQQEVGQIPGSSDSPPRDAVFSQDGRTLTTWREDGDDGVVERWNVDSGHQVGQPFVAGIRPEGTEGNLFDGLALSRDGRVLAVTTWGVEDVRSVTTGTGLAYAFGQDGSVVAAYVTGDDAEIHVCRDSDGLG